ncbi:dihydrofolate reductase family protein [Blastococcus sp. SYSU DS0533]
MRKIVVHLSVSLDGFFEGPDHDISWHLVDEELHSHMNAQLATASAFLEGRVTQELMAAYWPTADEDPAASAEEKEFAGIWRAMPKIVFSRTCDEVPWATEVRHEVYPDEIRTLQQLPGGDMVLGGPDLTATFRRLDLVDEYRLFVAPVLLGRGRRLFGEADDLTRLELLETRRFGNGTVMLRHGVIRD